MKYIIIYLKYIQNKIKSFRIALLLFYARYVCYKHTIDVPQVVEAAEK